MITGNVFNNGVNAGTQANVLKGLESAWVAIGPDRELGKLSKARVWRR